MDELTVSEAAAYLGRTPQAVRGLIQRSRLQARRVGPIFVLRRADVEALATSLSGKEKPGWPTGKPRRRQPR